MRLAILRTLSILLASTYAHPTDTFLVAHPRNDDLVPRQGTGIYRTKGIKLFKSDGSPGGRSKVRVFGLLQIVGTRLYDVFGEFQGQKNPFQAMAESCMQHTRETLLTHFGDPWSTGLIPSEIAADARWTALVTTSLGTDILVLGFAADSAVIGSDWDGFVTAISKYYQEAGLPVTIQTVDDAYTVWAPVEAVLGSNSRKREDDPICQVPTDLRQYFLNQVPGEFPGQWFEAC